jgi:hypothetical protein
VPTQAKESKIITLSEICDCKHANFNKKKVGFKCLRNEAFYLLVLLFEAETPVACTIKGLGS